ncbi:MAG: hypothetical protein CND01_00925 [Marine Group II euryarchaeote MED-G34]|nr:MAG: hypothetical protein CND01_00925 [Marine Group II euryarchaeote MED-G34]
MGDAERVKGLLDGSMDPTELEDDAELYALAERIYGREALDEMGVAAPMRPPEVDPTNHSNGNNLEVELPDIPEVEEIIEQSSKESSGRRIVLMAGLLGLILVSVNVSIGIGQYLELCDDQIEAPPLTYTSSSAWQNDTMHIAWSVTNLNTTTNYSIYWSMSQDGSSEFVDDGWFNWSGSSNMIHSENRAVTVLPGCYVSTLYSEGIEISQSNGCTGNSSTTSILAEISEIPAQCEDNTRLLWDKVVEYESIDSWAPAGSGGLLDGALLMLFGMITLRSAFRKNN